MNLERFQIHLTDHCNLNCDACDNFSNIADKRFLSVGSFTKDMTRVREIYDLVEEIILMGGEPLLNKHVNTFISVTRELFPETKIILWTNGLLIPKQTQEFFDTCKNNDVHIYVSVYTGTKEIIHDTVIPILKEKEVTYKEWDTKWTRTLNEKKLFDPQESYDNCMVTKCKTLHKGRFYLCSITTFVHILNSKYGTTFTEDDGIDIYKNTPEEINKYIHSPSKTCKHCSVRGKDRIEWSVGNIDLENWIIKE